MDSQRLFPIWLNLAARPVLIVGGGKVGWQKAASLLPAQARVTVVAPEACAELREAAGAGSLIWQRRAFGPGDLADAALVFAATDDPQLNHHIVALAREQGVLANAVDDPAHCDFFASAALHRGSVSLAVHTEGRFPGLAKALRELLEAWLPAGDDRLLESLIALRGRLRGTLRSPTERSRALARLIAAFKRRYLQPEPTRP